MTADSTTYPSAAATANRERATRWLVYALIAFAIVYTIFPVLWLFVNSFKTRLDMFAMPPIWIVDNPTLYNYAQTFVER